MINHKFLLVIQDFLIYLFYFDAIYLKIFRSTAIRSNNSELPYTKASSIVLPVAKPVVPILKIILVIS